MKVLFQQRSEGDNQRKSNEVMIDWGVATAELPTNSVCVHVCVSVCAHSGFCSLVAAV